MLRLSDWGTRILTIGARFVALLMLVSGLTATPARSQVGPTTPQPTMGKPEAQAEYVDLLEQQLLREPHRLGLQLDLAIALCQVGEWERAQREFLLLDSRPDLPPGISDVISWYRRSRLCREPTSRGWGPSQGFVAIGNGHHQNLNLGPSIDRLVLDGSNQVLELGDGSRPKSARGRHGEAGITWDLGALQRSLQRWSLSFYGNLQDFEGFPQYRLQGLNGFVSRRQTDASGGSSEFLLGSARLALGDGTRLAAQTAHVSRLWALGEAQAFGGAATLTLLDYAQRAALDARQLDTKLRWQQEGPSYRAGLAIGWLEDREVRGRPGGDRRGPYAQAQWAWAHPSGFSAETQWRAGLTEDRSAYSELLLGSVARRTFTSNLQAVLRFRIGTGTTIRLDARSHRSVDRLPLFSYSSNSVSLWLEQALVSRSD